MKILYVTTISATMGFFKELFPYLMQQGHEIELACNCENEFKFDVYNMGLKVHNIPFSRSPLSFDNIKSFIELKKLIDNNHYDVVHCHTPNASAITRFACIKARVAGMKVIYTAHGFHFYKGAPIINWLIYYPLEWICSHYTDVLITINSEDYKLARKKLKANKIEYVPGVGINLDKFSNFQVDIKQKRKELGIPQNIDLVLISIGELNTNKNQELVLRAIKNMNVYYLIVGIGSNYDRLKQVADEMGISDRVKFLGYRKDILELLVSSDIFVFPSFREGLSVSLMESMACFKPVVASNIRGNVDLIDDMGGALFNPHNVTDCKNAILKIIQSDRKAMGIYNNIKVRKFSTKEVFDEIDRIYGGFINETDV